MDERKLKQALSNLDSDPAPSLEALDTGALTDKTDGQAWETLRAAGFETGDVVPVMSIEGDGNTSTTSDTYTTLFHLDSIVPPRFGLPGGANLMANLSLNIQSGSGTESADYRARVANTGPLTEAVSITDTNKQTVSTGWHEAINVPSGTDRVIDEARSSATNSAYIEESCLQIGVEI